MSVDTEGFDEYWRQEEARGGRDDLGRFHALREEYRQFADRNWGRIQQIHEDNRKSRRSILAVLVVLLALQAVEGVLVVRAAREPAKRVAAVQQQRREGVQLQCAVLDALTVAGREVIAPAARPETPFTRFLESHGYPKPGQRRAQAKQLAQEYVTAIEQSVERQVGTVHARSIVEKDGSINCQAFQQLVVQHVTR